MKKLIILITLNLIGQGLTDLSEFFPATDLTNQEYINNLVKSELEKFYAHSNPNPSNTYTMTETTNSGNYLDSILSGGKSNSNKPGDTYLNKLLAGGIMGTDDKSVTSTTENTILTRGKFDSGTTEAIEKCVQSQTISRNQKTCKGELIFEETFQTSQLNSRVWAKEIRIPSDFDDADFVSYQDLPENCYIKNNLLHIVPTLLENTDGFNEYNIRRGTLKFGERCTSTTNNLNECSRTAQYSRILPPIVSARIGTRQNFSYRYGRIEIKAKLPNGDWIFPQLLLEPLSTDHYGENGYASGQIRIAFIRGNEILYKKDREQIDGFRLYGGVVVTIGEDQRDKFLINTLQENHLSEDYHVYSMTWTNESMTFELDGVVYGKIDGGFSSKTNLINSDHTEKWKTGEFMAPFDREFFVSLGVSAGGFSDFPDGCKNGGRRKSKPWINRDTKAELRFWNNRTNWYRTWNGEDAGLKVDYIRVWAL